MVRQGTAVAALDEMVELDKALDRLSRRCKRMLAEWMESEAAGREMMDDVRARESV